MKLSVFPFVFLASVIWVGTAQAQTTPAERRVFVASHVGPKWDDVYSESRRSRGQAPRHLVVRPQIAVRWTF